LKINKNEKNKQTIRVFSVSERGTVSITPEAVTHFTLSSTGHSRYQLPGDAAWGVEMLQKIRNFHLIH
jgi:hypothetical protein